MATRDQQHNTRVRARNWILGDQHWLGLVSIYGTFIALLVWDQYSVCTPLWWKQPRVSAKCHAPPPHLTFLLIPPVHICQSQVSLFLVGSQNRMTCVQPYLGQKLYTSTVFTRNISVRKWKIWKEFIVVNQRENQSWVSGKCYASWHSPNSGRNTPWLSVFCCFGTKADRSRCRTNGVKGYRGSCLSCQRRNQKSFDQLGSPFLISSVQHLTGHNEHGNVTSLIKCFFVVQVPPA